MKKVFVVACLSVFVLASCKKDYTCTYSDGTAPTTYSKISKTQATVAKSSCTVSGGTWSKK